MKKVTVKRLVYRNGSGDELIGGQEFSGFLTDNQILGVVHEIGKTQWIGESLWLIRNGRPIYRITVEPFTQYQKSWFDYLIDTLRRV